MRIWSILKVYFSSDLKYVDGKIYLCLCCNRDKNQSIRLAATVSSQWVAVVSDFVFLPPVVSWTDHVSKAWGTQRWRWLCGWLPSTSSMQMLCLSTKIKARYNRKIKVIGLNAQPTEKGDTDFASSMVKLSLKNLTYVLLAVRRYQIVTVRKPEAWLVCY